MKAAFLIGERKLEVRNVKDPQPPKGGLVLEIKACGICGSDIRRWNEGPSQGTSFIVLGHEIAGEVIQVGRGITTYAIGERLAVAPDIHCGQCYYCRQGMYNLCDNLHFIGISPEYPGGFAEKLVLPRAALEHGVVHRLPEKLSFVEGALAEPLSSVLALHHRVAVQMGDVVTILGAGPIGCLHAAVAKARGAFVIISDPSESRRALAKRFRPDLIVNPLENDVIRVVREVTDGIGASIVICANPVAATQTQAVEMVRKRGVVVFFGGLPGSTPMTKVNANIIHYGEVHILGSFSYHPRYHELALKVISHRLIAIEELVTHEYPLEEIQKGFEVAASGAALKVMIKPRGDKNDRDK